MSKRGGSSFSITIYSIFLPLGLLRLSNPSVFSKNVPSFDLECRDKMVLRNSSMRCASDSSSNVNEEGNLSSSGCAVLDSSAAR